jgi:tRNA-specific 2-thiouridylase
LRKGVDESRDQSYFLFGLTQRQLERSSFPLGAMQKSEVRSLAQELRIPVAQKPESHEICFVPNGDYAHFVESYLEQRGSPMQQAGGEIVTTGGKVLGEHAGVHRYTIGQRRGLGVAVGDPMYVVEIQPAGRRVVVGPRQELLRKRFLAAGLNWISIAELKEPLRVHAKIRHQFRPAPALVRPTTPLQVEVEFDEPQPAVTPGQAVVFYDGDLVIGGGWIA